MKEARFVYHCRLCGAEDDSLCCGKEHAAERLIECMTHGKSIRNDLPVSMVSWHNCSDGSMGVADLTGYRLVDTMSDEKT